MKFKRNEKRKVRANVDLTPLIDVVFQLLIFFMLASTFVASSQLPIEMPQAEGTAELSPKDVSITLQHGEGGPGGAGPVFFNDVEMRTMAQLRRSLEAAVTQNPEVAVLIRPDARIRAERLIQVLGMATELGVSPLNIQAETAGPPADDDLPAPGEEAEEE